MDYRQHCSSVAYDDRRSGLSDPKRKASHHEKRDGAFHDAWREHDVGTSVPEKVCSVKHQMSKGACAQKLEDKAPGHPMKLGAQSYSMYTNFKRARTF